MSPWLLLTREQRPVLAWDCSLSADSLGGFLGRGPSPSQRFLLVCLSSSLEGVTEVLDDMLTVKLLVVTWSHQTFWMWPPEGMELAKGV